MNTTVTETMQTRGEGNHARHEVYGDCENGVRINLTVSREDAGSERRARFTGRTVVRWSVDRGRGWETAYRARFDSADEAGAFAAAKWETMKGWAGRQVAVRRVGAVEAFSASVASMRS